MEATELDPRVYLVANDNWLEFTLRYVVDYKRRRITKDRLFTGQREQRTTEEQYPASRLKPNESLKRPERMLDELGA